MLFFNKTCMCPAISILFYKLRYITAKYREHHTHFNVYVSQRSQIQFEDKNHAIYMSFRWVTTT